MTKRKLQRFAENLTFPHLIQPQGFYPPVDHELKGKWKQNFFKNERDIILELGCGRGEYTVNLARMFPNQNFIGVDWKGARLWKGAKDSQQEQITNTGFLRIQIQNVGHYFGPGEVKEIWITFPDPQPGKRGERKRLTSPRFLEIYRTFLSRGGIIHLKTDDLGLYEYTLGILDEVKASIIFTTDDLYATTPEDPVLSLKTTYEKIWLAEGKKICYLKFCFT